MKLFVIAFIALGSLSAQTPDCKSAFQLTGAAQTSIQIDNRQSGCNSFTVAYVSTGFSAVSLTLESSLGAVSPTSFTAFTGSTVTGSNPATSITGTLSTFSGYVGWLRIKLTSATGTGTITGVLYGYKNGYGKSGSGGSVTLAGDATGPSGSNTVGKVDGVAYPASPSTSQIPVITSSNNATYESLPNCPTGGLGYTVSTFTFGCNTIPAATAALHSITFVLDGGGSALTTGALSSFPTADFACTILRTDVSADQTGSITVDVWKKAGAIPAGADKISGTAPVTLASSQLNQNGSISGWTTAVSVGDVFGGTIATAATVQRVTVQIWCQ